MPRIDATIAHNAGVPLGGLGTGSVEIRPDGCFHDWQIFNLGEWGYGKPEHCPFPAPEMRPDALGFCVRTQEPDGTVRMRRLSLREDLAHPFHASFLKNVEAIRFDGRFPVVRLAYADDTLPIAIGAEIFAPFVPHDAEASGTPGFHVTFRFRNLSKQPLIVSLLGTLQNPLATGATVRKLRNESDRDADLCRITLRTDAKRAKSATTLGSMSFAVKGGHPSWTAGTFAEYLTPIKFPGASYGKARECLHFAFRRDGALPSLGGETEPYALLKMDADAIDALSFAKKQAAFEEALRYDIFAELRDRVDTVLPGSLETDEGLARFLKEVKLYLDTLARDTRRRQTWGDAALASAVALQPGADGEVTFTVAWHFPNHFSVDGRDMGHAYANRFEDAEAVSRFLVENFADHRAVARTLVETLSDTSLPEECADAWSAQLASLVKMSWWDREGLFGIWEGWGFDALSTVDVGFYGSFPLPAFFPELQLQQRRRSAGCLDGEGRMHHAFRGDLATPDGAYDRADLNPQYVLEVVRDYLWTGDRAYLESVWPAIVKCMQSHAMLDHDGDGLADRDTHRNTYDSWDFRGTPAYIGSLWIGALKAAIRAAEDLGHGGQAESWRQLHERAVMSFEEKLWNGHYYSLWVDGAERDECCMTDQLAGEWYTHLVGLGRSLDESRVRRALRAILSHCASDEDGLVNAAYPDDAEPRLATYQNLQAIAPWSGVEYAFASMLADWDMPRQAFDIVANVHDRYLRAGRFWDHHECGGHYTRAMSIWALLPAAGGFKLDVPKGSLTLAPPPALGNVRVPWVTPTGYGTVDCSPERVTIECAGGRLAFGTLRLRLSSAIPAITLGGEPQRLDCTWEESLAVLRFRGTIAVTPGTPLVVTPAVDQYHA